ncbi:MAG: hypothetical protein QF442_00080 [Candidatus Peribacteraceae bacterium]|jgi:predicted permease|nr:hypothetical protein [Candidatus Peribacteraceae bacterium]
MNLEQIAGHNLRIQSWINFLSGATFLVPVITLFYKHTGLSLYEIVIISNVATFAIWLLEIPTSVFADTVGRKYSLQRSVLCNLFGAATILFFPNFIGFVVASLLNALNMPTTLPEEYSRDEIRRVMSADKKASGGRAKLAVPVHIGHGTIIDTNS